MGRKKPETAEETAREMRRRRALDLRLRGYKYQEIADELGVSVGTAHKDVTRLLTETRRKQAEDIEHQRQIESARLDERERTQREVLDVWLRRLDEADTPDEVERATRQVDRADAALDRIARRRAALQGLDAPQRSEVSATVTQPTVDDLGMMTDEQLRQAAQQRGGRDTDRDPG